MRHPAHRSQQSGTVHAPRGRTFQERLCNGTGCCTTQHVANGGHAARTLPPMGKRSITCFGSSEIVQRRGPCSPDSSGNLLAFRTLRVFEWAADFDDQVCKTTIQLIRGSKSSRNIAQFGEKILYKPLKLSGHHRENMEDTFWHLSEHETAIK